MTTTETSPGTAVARDQTGPRELIASYTNDFASVLPSHIKAATWVRVAQGALKKGKKKTVMVGGRPIERFELEIAAENNPAAFLSALLDAARQGLEPGTEQYYLTPRMVKGQLEILGMRGYQGEVELIYRAGAVSSVIAEVVYSNDRFDYQPGRGAPVHTRDWDAEDRGELRLVYAYAVMKDGALSKVIVLNKADIARIKSFAQGVDTDRSPWKTSEAAMWLKSSIHQLQKWVPTSAEYITTQVRAMREGNTPAAPASASAEVTPTEPVLRMQTEVPGVDPNMNADNIFDAELVPTDEEPGAEPAAIFAAADARAAEEMAAAAARAGLITKGQLATLQAQLNAKGVRDNERRCKVVGHMLDATVEALDQLTTEQAEAASGTLENLTRESFDAAFGDL